MERPNTRAVVGTVLRKTVRSGRTTTDGADWPSTANIGVSTRQFVRSTSDCEVGVHVEFSRLFRFAAIRARPLAELETSSTFSYIDY